MEEILKVGGSMTSMSLGINFDQFLPLVCGHLTHMGKGFQILSPLSFIVTNISLVMPGSLCLEEDTIFSNYQFKK